MYTQAMDTMPKEGRKPERRLESAEEVELQRRFDARVESALQFCLAGAAKMAL